MQDKKTFQIFMGFASRATSPFSVYNGYSTYSLSLVTCNFCSKYIQWQSQCSLDLLDRCQGLSPGKLERKQFQVSVLKYLAVSIEFISILKKNTPLPNPLKFQLSIFIGNPIFAYVWTINRNYVSLLFYLRQMPLIPHSSQSSKEHGYRIIMMRWWWWVLYYYF